MKEFRKPEIEIIDIAKNDIIATSDNEFTDKVDMENDPDAVWNW